MADTHSLNTKIIFALKAREEAVEEAADVIRNGGIVVMPTETVYGLGADAFNAVAVKKIFDAKGRPQDNPLIVHISDMEMLDRAARSVPECARQLMDAYWPGPLSVIMKKTTEIPGVVSAGLDTVAVRMPGSDIAREIIAKAGVPVAAPSANVSGRPSPTTARHAYEDLCGRVPLIIDGGACMVGVESTVVDVTSGSPVVLRPGAVTADMIRSACGVVEVYGGMDVRTDEAKAPPSPGMKYRHYAPKADVYVYRGDKLEVAKSINTMYYLCKEDAVILCSEDCVDLYGDKAVRSLGSTAHEAEAALFSELRLADEGGRSAVLFHYTDGMGAAVENRIQKAAKEKFEL